MTLGGAQNKWTQDRKHIEGEEKAIDLGRRRSERKLICEGFPKQSSSF